MRILLVNDDGFGAPGLEATHKVMGQLYPEAEIWIIAPEADKSGQSHAVTLTRPIKIIKMAEKHYKIGGSPADCVLLGLQVIMQGKKPDLIISGINAGSNAGFGKVYSGTVAAAVEACVNGIPSLAIGQAYMTDHSDSSANGNDGHMQRLAAFKAAIPLHIANSVKSEVFLNMMQQLIAIQLEERKNHCYCLSINLPYSQTTKGYKVKPMGDFTLGFEFYRDSEHEYRIGTLPPLMEFPDQDIRDGYITVCPIQPDWTDVKGVSDLQKRVGA